MYSSIATPLHGGSHQVVSLALVALRMNATEARKRSLLGDVTVSISSAKNKTATAVKRLSLVKLKEAVATPRAASVSSTSSAAAEELAEGTKL